MARMSFWLLCLGIALTCGAVRAQVSVVPTERVVGTEATAVAGGGDAFVVEGKIVEVVTGDSQFAPAIVVKPPERDPALIGVTRMTRITKDGRPAGFGDLAVGDLARCRVVVRDNMLWALAITARSVNNPPIRIEGVIVELDLVRRTVAIKTPDPDERPVMFRVTDDTRITKNGQPARLPDVEIGDFARALLVDTNAGLVALILDAHDRPPPIPVEGRIVGLDPVRQIVAVQPPENDRQPVAFKVTADTRLTKDGRPARFGDLQIGDFARGLLVDTDAGLVALELHARSGQPPIIAIGVIARIDADHCNIVLKPNDPNRPPVMFHVTPDTQITKNGEPARFGDLEVGDHAKAALVDTPNGLVALSIRAEDEPGIVLRGRIVQLNPDAQVVALKLGGEDGEVVRIQVTGRTRLVKNGRPAEFADLRIGDVAAAGVVRMDDGLVALWLSAHTPVLTVAGVIADVNYERHWFALSVGDTDRVVEFLINENTSFLKNGRPARFTDIHPRDQAMVKLVQRDGGNVALLVCARGD
jgi:hypothetical protein